MQRVLCGMRAKKPARQEGMPGINTPIFHRCTCTGAPLTLGGVGVSFDTDVVYGEMVFTSSQHEEGTVRFRGLYIFFHPLKVKGLVVCLCTISNGVILDFSAFIGTNTANDVYI